MCAGKSAIEPALVRRFVLALSEQQEKNMRSSEPRCSESSEAGLLADSLEASPCRKPAAEVQIEVALSASKAS
jgi:hypothetical protein